MIYVPKDNHLLSTKNGDAKISKVKKIIGDINDKYSEYRIKTDALGGSFMGDYVFKLMKED